MITWVIGSGGLLGSAVARRCEVRFEPGPIPWEDAGKAGDALREHARAFADQAGTAPWRVIWAAGAATTSASTREAMAELIPLEGLIEGLRANPPKGTGAFFLASSAGGVYAGSPNPPYGPASPTHPLSAYGELKLEQERRATDQLKDVAPVVIGRLANLYGPGQNLAKLQGLISRLALASVTRQPVNVFVPLETLRDYLHADDAAEAVTAATDDVARTGTATTTHVIASGRPTSVGQLIRTMGEITKRRVPVALGSHPSSAAQAIDLRLTPTIEIQQPTSLPAGIRQVHGDILERIRSTRCVETAAVDSQ